MILLSLDKLMKKDMLVTLTSKKGKEFLSPAKAC